ncbi:MAG: hypothetical protein IKL03_04415 [Bacteroidaceae bacterium]|nr:hypothetical protein [Bacteroidaceae bacterium]
MKKITLLAMSFVMALTVKAQNGEDVTSLLTNASFDAQTSAEQTPVTGWEGEFQTQTASYENFTGTFAEKWCGSYVTGTGQTLEEDGVTYYKLSDFNCSQTIEVENGVYVLGAYVIANNQQLTRLNPVEGVQLCANEDITSCASGNGVPAWHQVSTIVTDGKLTVALRTRSTTANWVAWDGIVLTRYTGETVEAAKLAWVLDELNKVAETALELVETPMEKSLIDAIQASVDAIADVASFEAGAALLETLNTQVANAELSIEAYAKLAAVLDAANAELDRDFSEGLDAFYDAIDVAQAAYDGGTLNVEGVEAAILKLQEDIYTFQMLNADGTERFDVTDRFMTNPTLRKNADGWAGSQPGLEYEVMEFYNSDFDMYQTLTDIPNGMYVVQVQGFYRTGSNDSGAAYQGGTENITAQLYANDDWVPLVSMYKYTASEMGVTSEQVLNDYVNMRVATQQAFNATNTALDMPYYAENEVTVIVQDGTLKLGLRNTGHLDMSWCAFRDFKLYYYGNFPAVVLRLKLEEAESWLTERADILPVTAYNELSDACLEADEYTEIGAWENEEVNEVLDDFIAVYNSVKNVETLVAQLKELTDKVESVFSVLEYPGWDALYEVYDAMTPLVEEGAEVELSEDQTTEQYYQEAVATLKAAIRAYHEQEVVGEEPLDYTHLITLPNFSDTKDYTIPAPWVVDNVQKSGDVWVGPGQPDAAGDGTNLPCLNSWSNDFTSMDVHQDLDLLGNGIYSLSVQAITQGLGQQHAYAIGSMNTVVSEDMTVVGWDTNEWETLETDQIIVLDGKLRIGFASVSAGGVNGWYQVTNFKLKYHGPAEGENLKGIWESTLARAKEFVNILLPGDSKGVQAAIEAATPLADAGKYLDAYTTLKSEIDASDSIFKAVQRFYAGNYETINTMAAELDNEVNISSAKLLAITKQLVSQAIHAEDATHKILAPLDAKLAAYVEYATYLMEVENTLATFKGVKEEYKTFVKDSVITPQVDALTAEIRNAADTKNLLAKLQKAMKHLEGTTYVNLPVGNLTEDLIVNYDIEADANASGWTVVKGDAQNAPTNSGEHYDNRTPSNRYLDAWHPSSGVNNITMYQEIVGLPDGTYQLTVATRTDGDNVYVFASPEALAADTAKWTAATQWDMVKNYGAYGGEIYAADTLLWHELDGVGEFPYMEARGGEGYGWSYNTINVQVTNHYLMIGITANKLLTGQAQFTGTWLGADDWKLVLVEKAAVQSDYNPFAGIENVEAIVPAQLGIYDLFGRRVETPTATGIYIVNGKKTFIKK